MTPSNFNPSNFQAERARRCLQDFRLADLFIDALGWEGPTQTRPETFVCQEVTFTRRQVAQLSGVVVFELTAADGQMPDTKMRAAVQREISQHHHENLLIFTDRQRLSVSRSSMPQGDDQDGHEEGLCTQSLWYWVKRDGPKRYPRAHYFVKGQTGDLFLSKIRAMFVDLADLDEEGHISVVAVAQRMQAALDVERVTKKFFDEFQRAHGNFLTYINGISDEEDRRWYTSVILNRVMFTWFLQRKGFLDAKRDYLRHKLRDCQQAGSDRYYREFLQTLFFEGFGKLAEKRAPIELPSLRRSG